MDFMVQHNKHYMAKMLETFLSISLLNLINLNDVTIDKLKNIN